MAKDIQARKVARKILLIFTGLLIGIPLVAITFFALGSTIPTGSTAKMENIANQFQPGTEWTLKSDRVKAPHLICLKKCNEVRRVWTLDTNANTPLHDCSPIETIASRAIRKHKTIDEHRSDDQDPDRITLCRISATIDGYPVELTYSFFPSSKEPLLILQVN